MKKSHVAYLVGLGFAVASTSGCQNNASAQPQSRRGPARRPPVGPGRFGEDGARVSRGTDRVRNDDAGPRSRGTHGVLRASRPVRRLVFGAPAATRREGLTL